jgi:hypothetical protein
MKSGVFGKIEGKDEKVSVGQEVRQRMNWISFMKQQFLITLTVRQNEILVLVDSWVTDAPSAKMLCQRKKNTDRFTRTG